MNSQQTREQKVQDDRYSNLSPKETPGVCPRDPVRNPKFIRRNPNQRLERGEANPKENIYE